jgi:hypothetical protein
MFVEAICREELNAPDRMVRLFALEEAIQEANSPEFLEALKTRLGQETDEECRLLLIYAVSAVQSRLSPTPSSPMPLPDPDCWAAAFAVAREEEKITLLSRIPSGKLSAFAHLAPDLVRAEQNPRLLGAIIRRFAACWPFPQRGILFELIDSPHRPLVHSVLSSLCQIAPQELSSYLPELLADEDLRVRGPALRSLVQIDLEEALVHFEELLFAPLRRQRLMALTVAFHLPFERLKPLLYRFLVVERDPELLRAGGDFFLINPDPQVPYRLLEIVDAVAPDQRPIIESVVSGVCRAIRETGLHPGEFDAYLEAFRQAIREKHLDRRVRTFLQTIEPDSGIPEDRIAADFATLAANPAVRARLEAVSPDLLSPMAHNRLHALCRGETQPAAHSAVPVADAQSWDSLSDPEKIRFIGLLALQKSPDAPALLQNVLSRPDSSPDLMGAALRSAARLRLPGFVSQAEEAVHSPLDETSAQAVEYLGELYPDRIVSQLHALLLKGKRKTAAAVFRVLKKTDLQQARRAVELALKQPSQADLALDWMYFLDFSLVRDLLAAFLATKPPLPGFQKGLALFQTNPDPENVFFLLLLEKTLEGEYTQMLAQERSSQIGLLKELGILTPALALDVTLEAGKRADDEIARRSSTPPAYSLQAVRNRRASAGKKTAGIQTPSSGLHPAGAILATAAAALLLFFLRTTNPESSSPRADSRTTLPPSREKPHSSLLVPSVSPVQSPDYSGFPPSAAPLFDISPEKMEELLTNGNRRADFLGQTREQLEDPRQ